MAHNVQSSIRSDQQIEKLGMESLKRPQTRRPSKLASSRGSSQFFDATRRKMFSARSIEKLGGAWGRGYLKATRYVVRY